MLYHMDFPRVRARDGDAGSARRVIYTLEENPEGYFAVDIDTGAVTVDRQLDRESPAAAASSGVLKLRVGGSNLNRNY